MNLKGGRRSILLPGRVTSTFVGSFVLKAPMWICLTSTVSPSVIATRLKVLMGLCRIVCQRSDIAIYILTIRFSGKTPLYVASREGHTACVRELLLRGANPNAGLPLHAAAQFNNEDCLRELLLSGAVVSFLLNVLSSELLITCSLG